MGLGAMGFGERDERGAAPRLDNVPQYLIAGRRTIGEQLTNRAAERLCARLLGDIAPPANPLTAEYVHTFGGGAGVGNRGQRAEWSGPVGKVAWKLGGHSLPHPSGLGLLWLACHSRVLSPEMPRRGVLCPTRSLPEQPAPLPGWSIGSISARCRALELGPSSRAFDGAYVIPEHHLDVQGVPEKFS